MRMTVRTWLALFALGLCLWLTTTYFSTILQIGWLLFGAFLLSVAVRPLLLHLEHYRIPRALTMLLIYLVMIGVGILLVYLLVPVISTEVALLRANAPTLLQQLQQQVATTPFAALAANMVPSADSLLQGVTQQLDTVVMRTVTTVADISQLTIDLLVLFVLAYLFATDDAMSHRWATQWLSDTHQAHFQQIWPETVRRLSRWSWAQVGIASYFAIVFSVGLALMGVPFAFTIGLVGGLLEIVPFLGGLIAMLLAVVSALTVDVNLAFWVVVFYIIVAAIESHVLAPVLYGRAIGLRSAFVLIALIVGAKSEGVLGVLFAVPIAVICSAILQELRTLSRPDREAAK